MRVAVVDIGTNSTRLLVADVGPAGDVTELARRSTVTRLGEGVATTGALGDAPMQRVFTVLDAYRAEMDELGVERTLAVLTSAVRDASNGDAFTATVRDRYRLDARTLSGDDEALMTYLGASSERPSDAPGPVVVIDIGGGSTEFVVGDGDEVLFHVSTQAGVVRQGERFLRHDPPQPEELQDLAAEATSIYEAAVPADLRARVKAGIAVGGTATQSAAIDQGLEPYDPTKIHGYRLPTGSIELLVARLNGMSEAERRDVAGLDPARAPTIHTGVVLLQQALRAFGLEEVEVSDHDILRGGALRLAADAPPS